MDRRRLNRAVVPGTQIQYRKLDYKSLFVTMSRPAEMIDISKSGICIPASPEFHRGEKIYLKIIFPDGKKLKLKGHIRWQEMGKSDGDIFTGIQFYPFGTSNIYNPLKALDYLRTLAGQRIEKIDPPQAEA